MVIDSGIFIEHLRAKDKTSTTLFKILEQEKRFISAVSLYELYMGASTPDKILDVQRITQKFIVLPFNSEVATKAGHIYHELKRANQLIEFRDIFIAATCLTFQQPILTLNRKHFERIKGLQIAG